MDAQVRVRIVTPEEFGLERAPLDALRVDSPEQSAALIRGVLGGEQGPARDVVLLNAGAALYAAGVAGDIAEGMTRAAEAVDTGRGQATLAKLVEESRADTSAA